MRKFIVICNDVNNNDFGKIDAVIENTANSWFRINNSDLKLFIITTENDQNPVIIRDAINEKANCSVMVMAIETLGSAAAHGEFASDKHWKWLNNFVTNDGENTGEGLPDAKLNYTKEENYI